MAQEKGGIPRDLLEKYFRDDPRLIAALEEQSIAVTEAVEIADGAVSGTQRMQDATIVTLSQNEDLNNEFILKDGDGTTVTFVVGLVQIDVDKTVARAADNGVTFIAPAEVTLFLPVEGELTSNVAPQEMFNKNLNKPVLHQPVLSGLVNADTDSEAAAAGVALYGMYRDGNVLCIRRT